jgi:hypothetical protein
VTEPVLIALIVSLPPTVAATAALVMSIRNGRKIEDVHISLNSRLSQLLQAENAKGRQDERDSQNVDS